MINHNRQFLIVLGLLCGGSTVSFGETDTTASAKDAPMASIEANVLWPFFPGGISEFKVLLPVVDIGGRRGEVLIGLHSDFMQRDRLEMGKVNILAVKIGFRQYLWRGLHVEASTNLGWRMEHERPSTGENHDDFVVSAWGLAGYQLELSPRVYVNTRAGAGTIAFRSSSWPNQRTGAFFASDINFGIHF